MDLGRQLELFANLLESMDDARRGVTLSQNANGIATSDRASLSERRYRSKILDMAKNPEYAYLINALKNYVLFEEQGVEGMEISYEEQYELLNELFVALKDASNSEHAIRENSGASLKGRSHLLDLSENEDLLDLIQFSYASVSSGRIDISNMFSSHVLEAIGNF